MNEQDQQRQNDEEWANSGNWRMGVFYFSRRDSRPWVPKRPMFGRTRGGGTPNLANRGARIYMGIIVGSFFGLLLVLNFLQRLGWFD